jgi:hypothetical protein
MTKKRLSILSYQSLKKLSIDKHTMLGNEMVSFFEEIKKNTMKSQTFLIEKTEIKNK